MGQASLEPSGRRAKRKVTTRAELVRAGKALFSEEGLYGSRVEDLTERAGVAKGTFYLYFDGKEDLILAVLTEGFDRLGMLVESTTQDASTLEDVTGRIVEAHCVFFAENPDLLRIFHQMRGMLKFQRSEWRPLRRVLLSHVERLADCLARVPGPERLSSVRRVELASWLFGGVSGVLSVRVAADPKARVSSRMTRLPAAFAAFARAFAGHDVDGSARRQRAVRRSRSTVRA